MSPDIVKVSPKVIQWKVSADIRLADHDGLSEQPRVLFAETDKHQSVAQRYLHGRRWETTPLFLNIYARRFANGESEIRGCVSIDSLASQYYHRVDGMYDDMRTHGWRHESDPIPVYLSHDNHLLMGNQGNHRLAIANVLGIDHVVADIVRRHPASTAQFERAPDVRPELPGCATSIPAMTTEAERLCYYRLAKERATHGAIVELGAWLGASTAYIASGIRDSGVSNRAYVYDRFVWKAAHHNKKAGGPLKTSPLKAFSENLGPLMQHVVVRPGEIGSAIWRDGVVSLLICDAPKRIPEIARTLAVFAKAVRPGTLLVWQDFAYFPSYDIPAAMSRLMHKLSFVEGVYPGTTAVFRVEEPWTADEVTPIALGLTRWRPSEVEAEWDRWMALLPAPMRPRFSCGAAMFLCDLGAHERATRRLAHVVESFPDEVLPKWRYLIAERASLMTRYRPLLEVIPA